MSSRYPAEPQRGVALITVMLVIAIASIAMVEIAARQQFDLRRVAARNGLDQARQAALFGERLAASVLAADRRDNQVDSAAEIAQWQVIYPLEGGQISGRVIDLQGRFNLNNLFVNGKEDTLAVERFQRLLVAVDLDPNLSAAVIDWIDPDTLASGSSGAEDGYYSSLPAPYRAANRAMAHVSELRLVRGFETGYARLLPLVVALPEVVAINVNTAPLEVLQALGDGLDGARLETLVAERAGEEGQVFEKVADFVEFLQVEPAEFAAEGLAVNSRHFEMQALVELGRVQYRLYSHLIRNDNGATQVGARYRGLN